MLEFLSENWYWFAIVCIILPIIANITIIKNMLTENKEPNVLTIVGSVLIFNLFTIICFFAAIIGLIVSIIDYVRN